MQLKQHSVIFTEAQPNNMLCLLKERDTDAYMFFSFAMLLVFLLFSLPSLLCLISRATWAWAATAATARRMTAVFLLVFFLVLVMVLAAVCWIHPDDLNITSSFINISMYTQTENISAQDKATVPVSSKHFIMWIYATIPCLPFHNFWFVVRIEWRQPDGRCVCLC